MGSEEGTDSSTTADLEVPLDTLPLHSTDLLTVLDERGLIKYESPSIKRIFGYDQDEIIGEQLMEFIHPDDSQKVHSAFQNVVSNEGDTVETVEFRHKQADGSYTWVEATSSANPMPGENYVVNTRDISDRKEYEKELETANERLEELSSVISHDLQNPLHVAQARLQLAQEECDSEHLSSIADAQNRMEALIDDLQTLSQHEWKDTQTETVQVANLSTMCWQRVPTNDATLVNKSDQTLQTDRSRLAQLLENLFRNAVEHGGEDVTVTVGDCDGGFYIADDGSGIPESERSNVIDAGYTTSEDGTGLGLKIVRQVVDTHGWDLQITESATGGARFEITAITDGD